MESSKKAGWLPDWVKPPIQPGTEDAARMAALNVARKELTRRFVADVLAWANPIDKKFDAFSKKWGVDPRYVKLLLIRPTRFWPTLTSADKSAINTAKGILMGAAMVPSIAGAQLPATLEGEKAVDVVFHEMALWMRAKVGKTLKQDYYKLIETIARQHTRSLRRLDDPDSPLVDVASQISGFFKHSLRSGRETSSHRALLLRVVEDLID